MKKVFAVVVLSVSMFSACGGTVCDRIGAAESKFFAGKTECSSSEGGLTLTLRPGQSTGQCEASACSSAADQQALDAYASCVSKAPACTAGNEKAATSAAFTCAMALLQSASMQCVPRS